MILSALFLLVMAQAHPPEKALDDIHEAVLRYMLAGDKPSGLSAYCVAIDNKDPSEQFMSKFAGRKPPVRGASQCDSKDGATRDRKTKGAAVALLIGKVVLSGEARAEVEGGYVQNARSSALNKYFLERDAAGWKVVKRELLEIS